MPRRFERLLRRSGLDNAATLHDRDLVGQALDDADLDMALCQASRFGRDVAVARPCLRSMPVACDK